MKGQKAPPPRKLKHEKISGGKNMSSVHIKKNKEVESLDAKVAASNGSCATNAHAAKSLKSRSFNGREAQVKKQEKQDPAPTAGGKVKLKPQKKQVHETSEDDTQSSKTLRLQIRFKGHSAIDMLSQFQAQEET